MVETRAQVVQVANLRPQLPETAGLDAADHLEAVLAHGARVDRFLHDDGGGLAVDAAADPGVRGRTGLGAAWRAPTASPTIRDGWRRPSTLCCSPGLKSMRVGGNQWRFV